MPSGKRTTLCVCSNELGGGVRGALWITDCDELGTFPPSFFGGFVLFIFFSNIDFPFLFNFFVLFRPGMSGRLLPV
jgi:hypothetical protein